jgi:hypothetical protein
MHLWIALVFSLTFWGGMIAYALTMEQGADAPTRTIEDAIQNYVDVPQGALNWTVFGKTKEIEIKTKTEDGYDNVYSRPDFPPEVKALDGKEITIKGFMFPLDATEGQKQFLFGPFPVNCPFQYHVGPALVLEVHADEHPVTFSYDPVVLTGTLELVPDDPEYGTFYRLKSARQLKG